MRRDNRDILDVLKKELDFVEKGGYRNPERNQWRPQFVFEDSPTCLNRNAHPKRIPCTECVLMALVPPERRKEKVPCRHIPLNAAGETIDDLYRTGTQEELEKALKAWLKTTIQRLEQEKVQKTSAAPIANPTFFHRRD